MTFTKNLNDIDKLICNIAKKSIFKQSTLRNLYEFKATIKKAYFYGDKDKTTYEIVASSQSIKDEVIYTCNLEMPILKKGDKFYIVELDKTVIIEDVVRTSDNSCMYECKSEFIDDELSIESKRVAEMDKNKFLTKNELKEKLDKVESHWLIGKLMKVFKL